MSSATEQNSPSTPPAERLVSYYKIDDRKISLREYWNISPSWKILLPWLANRLNLNLGMGGSFRKMDSVADLAVAEEQIPALARASLQPLIEECRRLGFSGPRYHKFDNLRSDVTVSFVSMVHSSGECTLRLMHTLASAVNPPKESKMVVLLSQLSDGTYFASSNNKPQFRATPGIVINRHIGAPPAQLLESHRQRLSEFAQKNNVAERVFSEEQLDELWNRYERYTFEAGVKRGLYVQMTPAEIQSEQQVVAGARSLAAGTGEEHADVLLQLSVLQNKKPGWGSAVTILLVSLLLFVLAGTRQWSWSYVLILVPLLFFHELGHYAAMRLFRYRNLRMFFIPFFGAAVAGQHYNVPGWKKVVVSLMGPVPGIVFGGMIGVVGIILQNALLMKIAVVALILNGINLLPLLPLDGGWVFHALLFCRNPMVEAVFRVLAAFGLMGFGLIIHSKILMYLGIPMLLSVGVSYRLAQIASRVKAAGLAPTSEDDQNVPPETARAIITELKKAKPEKYLAKSLAQQTLQIFEMINARPPSWAVTGGLLFVYFISLGLAGVLSVVVIAAKNDAFLAGLTPHLPQAHRALACADPALKSFEALTPATPAPHLTIVAHFNSPADMNSAWDKLKTNVATAISLRGFGNSLFLNTYQAGQGEKALLKEVKQLSKSVFIATSNSPAILSLSALLASEMQAQELADELAEYFETNPGRLIPPWLPRDSRTPAQKAAHRLARQTYAKAEAATADVSEEPSLEPLRIEMRQAGKAGDSKTVQAVAAKWSKAVAELSRSRLSSLGSSNEVNPKIIELFLAGIAAEEEPAKDWREQAVDEMGALTQSGVENLISNNRFSCNSGTAFRKGARLEISMVVLNQVSYGAPAIAAWLCDRGASELKYDITTEDSR